MRVKTIEQELDDRVNEDNLQEVENEEKRVYGDQGGEPVKSHLDGIRGELQDEACVRLLPGYVRGFIEKSAPLLGIGIDGDLDSIFSIHPEREGALDEIWPVLEQYPAGLRDRLTVRKPGPQEECIWLRPGEPVFVKILEQVRSPGRLPCHAAVRTSQKSGRRSCGSGGEAPGYQGTTAQAQQ